MSPEKPPNVGAGLLKRGAICGLLILARWLPAKGRHVPAVTGDSWSDGPGLSLLAHIGMAVGVLVFTYAYLTAAV